MFVKDLVVKRFVELSDKILNHFVLLCDSSNKKTPGYEILQTTLLFDILSYLIITNQYETVALLRKQIIGSIKNHYTKYGHCYKWGEYVIRSDNALTFGQQVLIKPYHALNTKLLVQ